MVKNKVKKIKLYFVVLFINFLCVSVSLNNINGTTGTMTGKWYSSTNYEASVYWDNGDYSSEDYFWLDVTKVNDDNTITAKRG